jgi:hypothetical protein
MGTVNTGGSGGVPGAQTIGDAIANGSVGMQVFGAGPGVTSQINVQLTSLTDGPLTLSIPRGTQFVPLVWGFQIHPATEPVNVTVTPGGMVTVTVPTVCASRYGDQPAPTDGHVPYVIGDGPSPVLPIIDTAKEQRPALTALANRINMAPAQFEQTTIQFVIWTLLGGSLLVTDAPTTEAPGRSPVPGSGTPLGGDGSGPVPDDQAPSREEGSGTPVDGTTPAPGSPLSPGAEQGPPSHQPFDLSTITGIVAGPVLAQGGTERELTVVGNIFWGAVDLTIKAVPPSAIDALVSSATTATAVDSSSDAGADGGAIGGILQGLAGMGAPPNTGEDEHLHTMEKPPGSDYAQLAVGTSTTETPSTATAPDDDPTVQHYTIEQMQANRWAYAPTDPAAGGTPNKGLQDLLDQRTQVAQMLSQIYAEENNSWFNPVNTVLDALSIAVQDGAVGLTSSVSSLPADDGITGTVGAPNLTGFDQKTFLEQKLAKLNQYIALYQSPGGAYALNQVTQMDDLGDLVGQLDNIFEQGLNLAGGEAGQAIQHFIEGTGLGGGGSSTVVPESNTETGSSTTAPEATATPTETPTEPTSGEATPTAPPPDTTGSTTALPEVRTAIPDSAVIIEGPPVNSDGTPVQLRNDSCAVCVAQGMLDEEGIAHGSETQTVNQLTSDGNFTPGQGMNKDQLAGYLTQNGATVVNIPWSSDTPETMQGILANGGKVAAAIQNSDGSFHAVRVEAFTPDGNFVSIGDPASGTSVRMTTFDFQMIQAPGNTLGVFFN